jgi:hypothetical protein
LSEDAEVINELSELVLSHAVNMAKGLISQYADLFDEPNAGYFLLLDEHIVFYTHIFSRFFYIRFRSDTIRGTIIDLLIYCTFRKVAESICSDELNQKRKFNQMVDKYNRMEKHYIPLKWFPDENDITLEYYLPPNLISKIENNNVYYAYGEYIGDMLQNKELGREIGSNNLKYWDAIYKDYIRIDRRLAKEFMDKQSIELFGKEIADILIFGRVKELEDALIEIGLTTQFSEIEMIIFHLFVAHYALSCMKDVFGNELDKIINGLYMRVMEYFIDEGINFRLLINRLLLYNRVTFDEGKMTIAEMGLYYLGKTSLKNITGEYIMDIAQIIFIGNYVTLSVKIIRDTLLDWMNNLDK